jgi:hypothetical protein
MPAPLRPVSLLVLIVQQGGKLGIGYQHNVTALASIPAIGAPARHVLLAPKRHAPGATVAGNHFDDRLVHEHR